MAVDPKALKEKRERIILQILDDLSLDLNRTIEELKKTNPPNEVLEKFNVEAKSRIYYWLSNLYDEIEAREKNLETALDTSREIIKKLKEDTKKEIKKESSNTIGKMDVKEVNQNKRKDNR